MSFKLQIKFDDKTITKAKSNNLDDFDSILDGLKEKFGQKKRVK